MRTTTLGVGGTLLLPACVKNLAQYRFFTVDEVACLEAICEQLIPAHGKWPGARGAGVVNYIDMQLTGVFSSEQPSYRNGLAAVQEACLSKYGKHFEALDFDVQTEFCKDLEAGRVEGGYWTENSSPGFFNMVVDHTMQGFYGPPMHGGNRNSVSYRMIGFQYTLAIGQNGYRGESG